ncbi:MAG TPA: putative metal-binding motif-containing protein [Kofleriaceae bacterium]
MRRLAVLLLLGACGVNDGVQLTLQGPDVPAAGTTIEIVLAAQKVYPVDGQYTDPMSTTGEQVYYLVQAATAGELTLDSYDGTIVQIEPDDRGDEGDYTPVALVRDANHHVVGAGAVVTDTGEPFGVPIRAGQLVKAMLPLVPISVNAQAGAIADGQGFEVDCATGPSPSGFAWRPPGKPELRLVLPDDGSKSALDRVDDLDLDCDGFAADAGDCDDLNAAFEPNADDACDGMDTNCDQRETFVVVCPAMGMDCPTGSNGVAICDDTTGHQTNCTADPACLCAQAAPHCAICTLSVDANSGSPDTAGQPCSPSIGEIGLGQECGSDGCTIDVVGDVRWRADLYDPSTDNFTDELVLPPGTQSVQVRVQHMGPDFVDTTAGSRGSIELLLTDGGGGGSEAFPIELFDDPSLRNGCSTESHGATTMLCLGDNDPH